MEYFLPGVLYFKYTPTQCCRQQRLEDGQFDYDLFVCYAKEDMDWVSEHLMVELENKRRLRLCIHERDFVPGKNILDNISDCVEGRKLKCLVCRAGTVKQSSQGLGFVSFRKTGTANRAETREIAQLHGSSNPGFEPATFQSLVECSTD